MQTLRLWDATSCFELEPGNERPCALRAARRRPQGGVCLPSSGFDGYPKQRWIRVWSASLSDWHLAIGRDGKCAIN